jgi:hypothetical protein
MSQRSSRSRAAHLITALACYAAALDAAASALVSGETTVHSSPTGVEERCVAVARFPDGRYSPADGAEEARLCGIDFNAGDHALCPKVFSTSPGTLVYDVTGGAYDWDAPRFEKEACLAGGVVKKEVHGAPVSWKMSVNAKSTSATFANSALVYYHFARYFAASVHVPVAVLRTMDRQEHRRRVTARGLALSGSKAALKMNHAAWQALQAAEDAPASYRPTEELFTTDGQVYGVMLRPQGARYSAELNGTRASGWGDGQNRDFQKTVPFRALREDRPLLEAIESARSEAFKDPQLAKATGNDATPLQVAFWMSDLVDITLLDFLFSQQDRVGNIDFLSFWYWVQDGKPMRRPATVRTLPDDIAGYGPQLLKRTELGDNDAGVRTSYVNYTRRTGMLENLRHYRASAYERLLRLHNDFAAHGPLHEHVRTSFGLSEAEFRQVVANTAAAAGILHADCAAGRLRFDIEPEELLASGSVAERKVACGELR